MRKFVYICVLVSLVSLFCPVVHANDGHTPSASYEFLNECVSNGFVHLSSDNPYGEVINLLSNQYKSQDGSSILYVDLFIGNNKIDMLTNEAKKSFVRDQLIIAKALLWETESGNSDVSNNVTAETVDLLLKALQNNTGFGSQMLTTLYSEITPEKYGSSVSRDENTTTDSIENLLNYVANAEYNEDLGDRNKLFLGITTVALWVVYAIIGVVVIAYVVYIVCRFILFKKAGLRGYASFIFGHNLCEMCKLGSGDEFLALIALFPIFAFLILNSVGIVYYIGLLYSLISIKDISDIVNIGFTQDKLTSVINLVQKLFKDGAWFVKYLPMIRVSVFLASFVSIISNFIIKFQFAKKFKASTALSVVAGLLPPVGFCILAFNKRYKYSKY